MGRRAADSVLYAYKWRGRRGPGEQKHTVSRVSIAKRGGKQASEPDRAVTGLYSQGEMAVRRSMMQVVM